MRLLLVYECGRARTTEESKVKKESDNNNLDCPISAWRKGGYSQRLEVLSDICVCPLDAHFLEILFRGAQPLIFFDLIAG